jgi:hypothetical protein
MSALSRHAVSAFKRTTATALRTSAMSTLRPTSCAPRHLAASSQLPTRTFSVSAAVRSATATVQNDPKWKNGEKVTYDEVKPLTQSPSDVRTVTVRCDLVAVLTLYLPVRRKSS